MYFFTILLTFAFFQYVLNQAIIDLTSFNETSNIPAKDFFQINVYDACFQAINGLHYLHVIHNISKLFLLVLLFYLNCKSLLQALVPKYDAVSRKEFSTN